MNYHNEFHFKLVTVSENILAKRGFQLLDTTVQCRNYTVAYITDEGAIRIGSMISSGHYYSNGKHLITLKHNNGSTLGVACTYDYVYGRFWYIDDSHSIMTSEKQQLRDSLKTFIQSRLNTEKSRTSFLSKMDKGIRCMFMALSDALSPIANHDYLWSKDIHKFFTGDRICCDGWKVYIKKIITIWERQFVINIIEWFLLTAKTVPVNILEAHSVRDYVWHSSNRSHDPLIGITGYYSVLNFNSKLKGGYIPPQCSRKFHGSTSRSSHINFDYIFQNFTRIDRNFTWKFHSIFDNVEDIPFRVMFRNAGKLAMEASYIVNPKVVYSGLCKWVHNKFTNKFDRTFSRFYISSDWSRDEFKCAEYHARASQWYNSQFSLIEALKMQYIAIQLARFIPPSIIMCKVATYFKKNCLRLPNPIVRCEYDHFGGSYYKNEVINSQRDPHASIRSVMKLFDEAIFFTSKF